MQNKNMIVRLVELQDAEQLQLHCFPLNTLEETQAQITAAVQEHAEGKSLLLVAEVEGQVVGTVTLQRNAHRLRRHRAELSGLVVHQPYQGHGIARRLVEACHQQAQALGIEILELSCRGGEPAEQVYRRLGFHEYGRLPLGLIETQDTQQAFEEVYFYLSNTGNA